MTSKKLRSGLRLKKMMPKISGSRLQPSSQMTERWLRSRRPKTCTCSRWTHQGRKLIYSTQKFLTLKTSKSRVSLVETHRCSSVSTMKEKATSSFRRTLSRERMTSAIQIFPAGVMSKLWRPSSSRGKSKRFSE